MSEQAAELARLEERLSRGETPSESVALLLAAVQHYRRCRFRRGGRGSSERRAKGARGSSGVSCGHGRGGADSYTGAERVRCSHAELKAGDVCPEGGCGGRLYGLTVSKDVELQAAPPVSATVYEREVLRCSSCQKTFTAPLAALAQGQKYAPSVGAMVAVMRYGMGMPHHRLAQLQAWAGIPLAPSTQFERAEHLANQVFPVFSCLVKTAANSAILYSDDTGARILQLLAENRGKDRKERTGIFTTGIVAAGLDPAAPAVVLYHSGRRHAGENLDELLVRRQDQASELIHMADASSCMPSFSERIVAHCLVHARRYFVEAKDAFPADCERVLEDIAAVYRIEEQTRDMTPEERLAHHQALSAPVLGALLVFIDERLASGEVEPNGQLGKAFQYVKNHWEGLTRFLSVAGAPLDNNRAERALKTSIRHRKNSLFYKTLDGAAIGDVLMSVIATCAANRVDPFAYLTAVAQRPQSVRASPEAWLPWRWTEATSVVN